MTAAPTMSRRDAGFDPTEPADPPRQRRPAARTVWRTLTAVSVAAAAVVVVLVVISNADLLTDAARSAAHASPGWLLVAVAAMGVSFVASGIGIVGAAQGRVPIGRTVAAEFAGTFCNRLTPAGVGRTALRIRYLVCAGLSLERAASAVALSSIVGAVAYLGGMAAAGMDMRMLAASIVVSPGRHAIFLGSAALLMAALLMAISTHRWQRSRLRLRAHSHIQTLLSEIRDLAHDRWAVTALWAGPAVSSAAYMVAFWAALHSIGIGIALTSAAVIYVTSTAVAAAVPVPGGVGAAEITLTAGLTASGVSPGAALSGVLVFRLASLWLPSAVGALCIVWLRRIGALTGDIATAESGPVAAAASGSVAAAASGPVPAAASGPVPAAASGPVPAAVSGSVAAAASGPVAAAVSGSSRQAIVRRRFGTLTMRRRVAIAGGAVAAVTIVGTATIVAESAPAVPPAAAVEIGS